MERWTGKNEVIKYIYIIRWDKIEYSYKKYIFLAQFKKFRLGIILDFIYIVLWYFNHIYF